MSYPSPQVIVRQAAALSARQFIRCVRKLLGRDHPNEPTTGLSGTLRFHLQQTQRRRLSGHWCAQMTVSQVLKQLERQFLSRNRLFLIVASELRNYCPACSFPRAASFKPLSPLTYLVTPL